MSRWSPGVVAPAPGAVLDRVSRRDGRRVGAAAGSAGAEVRSGHAEWLDAVRGVAVLLVVLYHATIALAVLDLEPPRWLDAVVDGLAPLRVPVLVLLSGLLLPRSLRKPAGTHLWGKLRLIGWPWLVWTAVTASVLALGSRVAGDGRFDLDRAVSSALDPRAHTWYLAHLLLFYGVALLLPERVRSALVVPLLLGAGVVDDELWRRAVLCAGCFLLGDWVARRRPQALSPSRPVTAAAAVTAVTCVVLAASGVEARYRPWSVAGVAATVVVLGAVARRWRSTRPVGLAASVGRQSLVYYTAHWAVVAVVANALALVGLADPVLAVAVMVVAGLAVPAVLVALRGHRPVGLLFALPARRRRQPALRVEPSAPVG